MGYYVEWNGYIVIPPHQQKEAFDMLADEYGENPYSSTHTASNLLEWLDCYLPNEEGVATKMDGPGGISIACYGKSHGQEEALTHIAHLITEGHIDIKGEDDQYWRLRFCDGKMHMLNGHITYDDPYEGHRAASTVSTVIVELQELAGLISPAEKTKIAVEEQEPKYEAARLERQALLLEVIKAIVRKHYPKALGFELQGMVELQGMDNHVLYVNGVFLEYPNAHGVTMQTLVLSEDDDETISKVWAETKKWSKQLSKVMTHKEWKALLVTIDGCDGLVLL